MLKNSFDKKQEFRLKSKFCNKVFRDFHIVFHINYVKKEFYK